MGAYTQYPGDGGVLYTPGEYDQARRRPAPMRTPIPEVGDEVMYRHTENGTPVRATVIRVQKRDDFEDPNLFYWQTDHLTGKPVKLEGKQILKQAFDPWPLLWLRLHEPVIGPVSLGANMAVETREARMRGACGWLPLDWETRPQPAPPAFIVAWNGD